MSNILEEGRYGGPHRRIIEIAKQLEKDYSIKTHVVYSNDGSIEFMNHLNSEKIASTGMNLTRISSSFIGKIKYMATFIFEMRTLVRRLKEMQPALVHVNGSHQFKSLIASNFAGIPVAWHLNDTFTPKPIYILFRYWLFRKTNSFICSTRRTKEYYLNGLNYSQSVDIISAPVNCEYFSRRKRKRKDLNATKKVVMVANINPIKGIDVFLKTAKTLNDSSQHNFEFAVVGMKLASQRHYYETLEGLIGKYSLNNVKFPGATDNVKAYLETADYYLCTSNFESSAMSVLEAMSMELPVVSTNVGDLEEIFAKHNCGLIAEVGDYESLALHIIHLADNPSKAEIIGKNARTTALTLFDVSVSTKKHFAHYRALIN